MSAFQLRPYQLECLESVRGHWNDGVRRQLVVLPTGAGKTVVFSHLKPFLNWPGRMLVLAHREELLDQAADKIAATTPGVHVDVEQAGRRASQYADVVVASVASLGRTGSTRLARFGPGHFDIIVCDEAHHAVARTYVNIFEHFGAMSDGPTSPLLVGVTATPERSDAVGLSAVFDRVVYERTLRQMIEEGWLCRIRAWKVDTTVDMTAVHSRGGDYVLSELSAAVNTAYRNDLAVKSFLSANVEPIGGSDCMVERGQKRAIVFCADVQHAHDMADAFIAQDVPAAAVTGETPSEERKDMLRRFRSGELLVLTNCMVLTEGFDEPSIEIVIMARPTQSASLYMQMLGRGTRLFPGKEHLSVFDLVDNTRHAPSTTASLLGLPPKWDAHGGDVLKQVDELVEVAGASQLALTEAVSLEHARQLMREVDILAGREELRAVSRFSWMRMPDGSLRLNLPDHCAMTAHEDKLGQWHVARRTDGQVATMECVYESYDKAMAMADRFVGIAFPEAPRLVATDARWRRNAPSEKQEQILRKHKRWREGLTKGDASDIIDAIFARRAAR